jgi:hypothetical protein
VSYLIGFTIALLVAAFARFSGFDRDRSFYPTVVVVIALYYVLFAAMGGSARALVLESIMMTVFAALAVAGFKGSLWLVVAALAGHGVMDLFHAQIVENPGVPEWWPGFCAAADVGLALALAWVIKVAAPAAYAPHLPEVR